MRSLMSVPEVVREVITRNRSIYDCMKMDLINYTALAVKIQPEIEKILGNSVNLNTVVVAIKRYADSFETKEEMKEESVLKNARLALTDGIMDVKFSIKDFAIAHFFNFIAFVASSIVTIFFILGSVNLFPKRSADLRFPAFISF